MPITTIPRTLIKASLQGLRLPLTAVERVTHNVSDNDQAGQNWPPAVAFDSFEAGAKQMLGSLLRDDELVKEGKLQQAKLDELRRAASLRAEAQQTRAQADDQLLQRQDAADATRDRIEEQAAERERQVEQHKATAQHQVRAAAAQREDAAERVNKAREKAVTDRERAAAKSRIDAESAALETRKQALGAESDVQSIDAALEAKKARRS